MECAFRIRIGLYNGEITLSPFESTHVAVQSYSHNPSTSSDQMNVVSEQSSSISSSTLTLFLDPFQHVFTIDENIQEILSSDEFPWDDLHHRSSFLPDLDKLEKIFHPYL